MPHEWMRKGDLVPPGYNYSEYEYAETDTLEPPEENAGWVLVSKFGVGRVKGAGGSPARSS